MIYILTFTVNSKLSNDVFVDTLDAPGALLALSDEPLPPLCAGTNILTKALTAASVAYSVKEI